MEAINGAAWSLNTHGLRIASTDSPSRHKRWEGANVKAGPLQTGAAPTAYKIMPPMRQTPFIAAAFYGAHILLGLIVAEARAASERVKPAPKRAR
jgi:hypothetical protein